MDVNVDDSAVWWTSGLNIDADGAPNAYGPHDSGLDWTADAGHPGDWYGVQTDLAGNPVVQGPQDPYPGMWVATTSLQDHSKKATDPARYVDATKVAYLSIPSNEIHDHGLHPGDVGVVHYQKTGKTKAVVVGDVGPRNKYGEGSMALADALGIPNSPRHGGCGSGVCVVVFRGSSKGWPRADADVAQQASDLLSQRPDLQKFLTT